MLPVSVAGLCWISRRSRVGWRIIRVDRICWCGRRIRRWICNSSSRIRQTRISPAIGCGTHSGVCWISWATNCSWISRWLWISLWWISSRGNSRVGGWGRITWYGWHSRAVVVVRVGWIRLSLGWISMGHGRLTEPHRPHGRQRNGIHSRERW